MPPQENVLKFFALKALADSKNISVVVGVTY